MGLSVGLSCSKGCIRFSGPMRHLARGGRRPSVSVAPNNPAHFIALAGCQGVFSQRVKKANYRHFSCYSTRTR